MAEVLSVNGVPNKKTKLNGQLSNDKVTVVIGAQFGDEGKGKIVDMLSQEADVVCRCQVSRVANWRSRRNSGLISIRVSDPMIASMMKTFGVYFIVVAFSQYWPILFSSVFSLILQLECNNLNQNKLDTGCLPKPHTAS